MVSVIPKHIAAFIVGIDANLYRKYKDESLPDNLWTGWAPVGGGQWVGDPVTIKRIDGEVDIFLLDQNHALNHGVFNFLLGHDFIWKNLGGKLKGPPAVTNNKDTIHVFHIGTDHGLYHNSYDGKDYTPLKRLGGPFLHTPAAVSVGEKDVYVFVIRLADARLCHYHWTGSKGWAEPKDLPGVWTGALSAVSDQDGNYDVFGIDTLGKVNHVSWRNGQQSFETLDTLLQTVDAVSWGPGRIDLIGLGFDSGIYHTAWDGNSWVAWESLGGVWMRRPTPVSHSPGALCVLNVGWNHVMYIRVRDPSTGVWGAWTDIQGVVASRVA